MGFSRYVGGSWAGWIAEMTKFIFLQDSACAKG